MHFQKMQKNYTRRKSENTAHRFCLTKKTWTRMKHRTQSRPILTRRLVSSDEAEPMKFQHRKPCADCPFTKNALNGWLGANTLREWLAMIHGEAYIDCHCTTNQQCAGAAIFRANLCKTPRHSRALRLEPDNGELVFTTDNQFIAHHTAREGNKTK